MVLFAIECVKILLYARVGHTPVIMGFLNTEQLSIQFHHASRGFQQASPRLLVVILIDENEVVETS